MTVCECFLLAKGDFMERGKIKWAAFFVLFLFAFAAEAAFEQSVDCSRPPGKYSYFPLSLGGIVDTDGRSRFVTMSVEWGASSRFAFPESQGLGYEFKFHHYNYDDAAATGKGPAYVLSPGGFWYCDLPGCYIDSDWGSRTNSAGERNEPIIGFGIAPGHAARVKLLVASVTQQSAECLLGSQPL